MRLFFFETKYLLFPKNVSYNVYTVSRKRFVSPPYAWWLWARIELQLLWCEYRFPFLKLEPRTCKTVNQPSVPASVDVPLDNVASMHKTLGLIPSTENNNNVAYVANPGGSYSTPQRKRGHARSTGPGQDLEGILSTALNPRVLQVCDFQCPLLRFSASIGNETTWPGISLIPVRFLPFHVDLKIIKALLPSMLRRNSGHIVTVASVCGHRVIPYLIPYW